MKYHLYHLPPCRDFGEGWLIMNENDYFQVLASMSAEWDGIMNTTNTIEAFHMFLDTGEEPSLVLTEASLEEVRNYMRLASLMES